MKPQARWHAFWRSPYATFLFGCLLFIAFYARSCFHALLIDFSADERMAIAEAHDHSFSYLAFNGPTHELNTSPLHYLIDKAWLSVFNSPHHYWNLRLFFRLLPSLWWSLACVLVFAVLRNALIRIYPSVVAHLAAIALAAFLFSKNTLADMLTVDRPYSLWVLLCFLHALFFLLLCDGEYRKKKWVFPGYAISCLLLPLTAFVSILQVVLATAVLAVLRPGGEKLSGLKNHFLVFLGSLAIAIWFFHTSIRGEVHSSQLESTLTASLELLPVSFRISTPFWYRGFAEKTIWLSLAAWEKCWCVAVFFSSAFLLRNKSTRPFTLLTYGLILATVAAGVVVHMRGHILPGLRYFIFVFPYMFTLFLLTLFHHLQWIVRKRFWGVLLVSALSVFLLGSVFLAQEADVSSQLDLHPDLMKAAKLRGSMKEGCPANIGEQRDERGGILTENIRKLCR